MFKRLLIALAFLALTVPAWARTATWDGGGGDNLASTAANWDGPDTAPATGDDVVFDSTSTKNCTWDITTNLNTVAVNTGYSGVVTQTANLNVQSGATKTFSMNAGTWDAASYTNDVNNIDLSGSGTKVLTGGSSLWYVRGNLNMSGANTTFNYNTCKMYPAATGTVTMQSGVEFYKLSLSNPAGASQTETFATDVIVNNTLDFCEAGAGAVIPNSNKIFAKGDVKATLACYPQGTTVVEISGSAAQTLYAGGSSGPYGVSFIVNKSGDTLTIPASVIFGNNASSNTFTYTAGTVSVSAGTTKFYGTWNLNSGSGVVWDTLRIFDVGLGARTVTLTGNVSTGALTNDANMTLSCGSNTITLTGNFTNNGTFTKGTSTVVFNGTSTVAGATAFYSLTINAGKTVHLTSTQTFSTASGGTFTATGGTNTLDATTGGSRANFNVSGSQSVGQLAATDIDSSGGNQVHNYVGGAGTNTNTVNWDTTAPATGLYRFFAVF